MNHYFNQHFHAPFCGQKPYFCRRKYRQRKPKSMSRVLPFLAFLLTTAFFIVGIFYFIARTLGRIIFDPGSSAWKRTIAKLQTRIRAQAAGALVPWDAEMLSLLSLNQSNVKKPGWWDSASEGVFLTIYQEPVLSYAGQISGNTSVFVARTSAKDFIFRQKEKETEVWINNQPFAVYINGVLLAAGRSSQMLARLEPNAEEAQWPVMIGDKAAAAITNPKRIADAGPNPRALTMLRKVSAEEENALLALTMMFSLKA